MNSCYRALIICVKYCLAFAIRKPWYPTLEFKYSNKHPRSPNREVCFRERLSKEQISQTRHILKLGWAKGSVLYSARPDAITWHELTIEWKWREWWWKWEGKGKVSSLLLYDNKGLRCAFLFPVLWGAFAFPSHGTIWRNSHDGDVDVTISLHTNRPFRHSVWVLLSYWCFWGGFLCQMHLNLNFMDTLI